MAAAWKMPATEELIIDADDVATVEIGGALSPAELAAIEEGERSLARGERGATQEEIEAMLARRGAGVAC